VVRADELDRVVDGLRRLRLGVPGASLELKVDAARPPLEERMSAGLYADAARAWAELGRGRLPAAAAGGASDGNLTAALGIPTLDGLGAVGRGAHAADESVDVDAMPDRAALVASLLAGRAAWTGGRS